jgi:NAD+-dependent protein deacetylase sirtuin 4
MRGAGAEAIPATVHLPAELVARCAAGGVVVLTGAGASTESGIPDYRSPGRPPRTPLQHREFVTSAAARARYWARSAIGWPVMSRAAPNPAHTGIAALEARGLADALITQNVDGLHAAAGSRELCELHGSIHRVMCLACGDRTSREAMQARLLADNPRLASAAARPLPDGDADLAPELSADLAVPTCERCGGDLKPDVVLFGDNVPRPTVERCYAWVDAAQLLLVVGSSLAVFSGYRFAVRAAERGIPIAIVNRGPTRADGLAAWRLETAAGATIETLVAAL